MTDFSEFQDAFYEESGDLLEIIESSLLQIDINDIDQDLINDIFRHFHSIKGTSGAFGLTEIAGFTHLLETLLDEIRTNKSLLTQETLNLLFEGADFVKSLIDSAQSDSAIDMQTKEILSKKFESEIQKIIGGEEPAPQKKTTSNMSEKSHPQNKNALKQYTISFVPNQQIFLRGNDPLFIFRTLQELGEVEVSCDFSGLPAFHQFIPDNAFLSWDIILKSNCTQKEVDDAFEWVSVDSWVDIEEVVIKPTLEDNQSEQVVNAEIDNINKIPEKKTTSNKSTKDNSSIRVAIQKVDYLINLIGEQVITQSMLTQIAKDTKEESEASPLAEGLERLEQNTRKLQECIMSIRMLPISFACARIPRLVNDLSRKLNKNIELVLIGENTEVDKTVIEKITDPIIHLVRNSIDHGIEDTAQRIAIGKSEKSTITINVFYQGSNVIVQISDDGGGLDNKKLLSKAIEKKLVSPDANLSVEEIQNLIFKPGFSTAEAVSDISGRGVGMDVVRSNINEIGGSVKIASQQDYGTTITITLPLTLAILDGQLINIDQNIFIIPIENIVQSLDYSNSNVFRLTGTQTVFKLRDTYIPIISLKNHFNIYEPHHEENEKLIVIVEFNHKKIGLLVDELLEQQQVVVKSLDENYKKIHGISSGTILGTGKIALILDIAEIISTLDIDPNSYDDLSNIDASAA